MQDGFSIDDILGILRRRWLVLLLPLCIGAPLAAGVAMLLPPVYSSTARLLVESQQIPDDLARSTIPQSANERIQLIQQRLLTRQNLLEIAEQYRVFAGRPDMSSTDVVNEMRLSTTIQGTAASARRRANTVVTGMDITFRARDPATASRVANEFVSRVLSQNVQDRTERATSTVAFFEQEVQRLNAEMNARAAEISRFKTENQAALPETLSARQGELAALRERSQARQAQRGTLLEQRRNLEQAVALGRTATQVSPEESELIRLRATLVQQRATLAESHPSIRQLMARIEALERSLSAPRSTEGTAAAGTVGIATQTMLQIESINQQIELLDGQEESARARIAELEASISRTPGVEVALSSLERDYVTLQSQYRDAVLKRGQAQTGERLEASQQAERLEVIEQAVPAETPISPNRPLIMAAGVVGSLGIGGALTLLLELLNRAVRTSRDIERQLGIRPLIAIPRIQTAGERTRRRWLLRLLLLATVLGIPAAVAAVDQFVIPLPLLFDRISAALRLPQILGPLGIRL
jgi:polysaccharide chain length determinant protein (PEP-CTERM system associated)